MILLNLKPRLAIEPRVCKRCGNTFRPTARGQKYCGHQRVRDTCSWQAAQESTKKWMAENPDKMIRYRERWEENIRNDPERHAKHLERRRRQHLRRHGLTVEEYDRLHQRQGHVCAICGASAGRADGLSRMMRSKEDLAVDHDHSTGAIRGLLCDDCNIGLGLFFDDPAHLRAAADYLERCRQGGPNWSAVMRDGIAVRTTLRRHRGPPAIA